jgi:hypothetical protein
VQDSFNIASSQTCPTIFQVVGRFFAENGEVARLMNGKPFGMGGAARSLAALAMQVETIILDSKKWAGKKQICFQYTGTRMQERRAAL